MLHPRLLAALLLAAPFAAAAQTKPATTSKTPAAPAATAPQQVTEVTEELDPATGKVIRRTTRTTTVPAGTAAPATSSASAPSAAAGPADTAATAATDAQVTAFLRQKTTPSTLTAPALLAAYGRFMDRVRNDRHAWKASNWATAAAVLGRLDARYNQLRTALSLDDKLTIRSQQAEFQALRTARQLSDQVSDKL